MCGHPRTIVRSIAAAFTAALLAACGDSTAPPDESPAPVTLAEAAAVRTPNSVVYREHSARPATGRSGSATLATRALLGRDGITVLEVTTGTLDQPASAPGTMSHVQVKLFTEDGRLVSTDNYFPDVAYWTLAIPGLVRGMTVQVQANVRGIDGNRTDVVTVTTTVLRRPDLRASQLQLPDTAVAGVPVVISATIAELNGDVGARTDCVLEIQGDSVDVAPGIWVDAGDAVSCAFSHTFAAPPGTRTVTVRLARTVPADDDTSNDRVSGTLVVIVVRHDAFAWFAEATDERVMSHDSSVVAFTDLAGVVHESFTVRDTVHRSQRADFGGTADAGVRFPLTQLELGQWTGGSAVHRVVLRDVPATRTEGGRSCAGGDLEAGVSFSVCSGGAPATTEFRYTRRAGSVTYQSLNYARDWYRDASGTPYWVGNAPVTSSGTLSTSGAPLVEFGSDYRFLIRLNSDGWVWIKDKTLPVASFTRTLASAPWSCATNSVFGISISTCREHLVTASGSTTGEASGPAGAP